MNITDVVVIAAGLAFIGFLLWFFFEHKPGKAGLIQAGVQAATIRVEGAYHPHVVTVTAGMPVRLAFDRREGTDCSTQVVFPDFGPSRALPAFATNDHWVHPATAWKVPVCLRDEHVPPPCLRPRCKYPRR